MLLQAFDFMVLCRDANCELQIGGSDQWGNITAGIDLTRKKLGKTVYGLTLPLITNADGTKFGKTEAGAIWLDPKRTSVYRFYQFWINTDDRDAIRYLKFFTFLPKEEIEALEKKHTENPGAREAHRALAKATTDLIHGTETRKAVELASAALFGTVNINLQGQVLTSGSNPNLEETLKGVGADLLLDTIVEDLPHIEIPRIKFADAGMPLVELLVLSGLCPSKGQARKDIEGGGVNVNKNREANAARAVTAGDLLFGKHLLLRKGKKNYVVVTAK
jgi:tyrosyl-tRNA synthetase